MSKVLTLSIMFGAIFELGTQISFSNLTHLLDNNYKKKIN